MKHCQTCKVPKEDNAFVKNARICRACNNTKIKNFYKNNADYRQSVIDRATMVKRKLKKIISDFKSLYGCYFCNARNPVVLQYHHLDPSVKEFNVYCGTKRSLDSYRKEIDKCEIVCSNCHLQIHAGELTIINRRNIDSQLLGKEMVDSPGIEPELKV